MSRTANSPALLTPDAPHSSSSERVLTGPALDFVAGLAHTFSPRVEGLLAARRQRAARFDAGARPAFLSDTAQIREANWRVATVPHDLCDRRVELTGPVDRKMIVNGLNSGANVFMADFEDATSPTWSNVIEGQANLIDAVRGTIRYAPTGQGKTYELGATPATLIVRPRGWHLCERHLSVDGRAVPAALVDFGLFFFHNAHALVAKGSGPYFYLPKLESHLEARLWNDVFLHAQVACGLPSGTIRATVLIETLPAAFEMDEILYELREHAAGLNCGRWDYIFSAIKTLKADPGWIVPDRAQVTMEQPFLRAYTQLLVKTCHRRGAHAMGGMAAQIPIKDDLEANRRALDKVRADKRREVVDGHDGTWVAHPALVSVAREVFDAHLRGSNQLHVTRDDVSVGAADLLRAPEGTRTEAGLRHNVRVGVQYLEAWLRGQGCVPLYHLMEDAATAEISRTQIWQWLAHHATLDDGLPLTRERCRLVLREELERLRATLGAGRFDGGRFREASTLFERLVTSERYEDFLTCPAYELLVSLETKSSEAPPQTAGVQQR
jgi:malate synthase